jgi:chorismate mutase
MVAMDNDPVPRIDGIRADIDDLDRQLLGLVARRFGLVQSLVAAKAQEDTASSPLRPAREVQLLRRLIGYGTVDADVVMDVWRALIGASIRLQGGLEVVAAGAPGQDPVRMHDAARRHFGAAARITRIDDVRSALVRALDNPGAVAVVPWPGAGPGAWWPSLNETRFQPLSVVAALPLFDGGSHPIEAALVARNVRAEPAGRDQSLAVIYDPHHRLARALGEVGLPGREMARARELALLQIDGFLTPDDTRVLGLARAGVDGFRLVGSFARI